MSTRDKIADAIVDYGQVRYDLGVAAGAEESVPTQQALAATANRALRRALDLIDAAIEAAAQAQPGGEARDA